jgi:hypothetical protein
MTRTITRSTARNASGSESKKQYGNQLPHLITLSARARIYGEQAHAQLSRYMNVLELHSVRVSEEHRVVTRDVGVFLRWL